MKIKLGDLKVAVEGLGILAQKQLPIKTAYWIGKTINKLGNEFRDLEASRQKLCLKYCQKDEEGKPIQKKDETGNSIFDIPDMAAFNTELMELYNMEIDINFIPIPLEQLTDVKIDSLTMMKIEKFIVGDLQDITQVKRTDKEIN